MAVLDPPYGEADFYVDKSRVVSILEALDRIMKPRSGVLLIFGYAYELCVFRKLAGETCQAMFKFDTNMLNVVRKESIRRNEYR